MINEKIFFFSYRVFFIFKDRANNTNANVNEDEIDEEFGDLQLPLSLTRRASASASSTSHGINTINVIQDQQTPSSSLQHNVVLHSNINESSLLSSSNLPTNRFDLNLTNDKDELNNSQRQPNSLMTVYEQGSANDLLVDDSGHIKSSTSVSDVLHKRTTDEKQMV